MNLFNFKQKALKKSGKIDTFSAIYVDAKDETTGVNHYKKSLKFKKP